MIDGYGYDDIVVPAEGLGMALACLCAFRAGQIRTHYTSRIRTRDDTYHAILHSTFIPIIIKIPLNPMETVNPS
jgi:hypothetical protein